MKCSECLRIVAQNARDELFVVALGRPRILWANLYQDKGSYSPQAMGYITPFGLGLSLALPHRRVVVFDGDGSLFLNLGILTVIGNYTPKNLTVIIYDNQMYEAAGKLPTPSAKGASLEAMARASGIKEAYTVRELEDFTTRVKEALSTEGPHFIVAKVEPETINLSQSTMDARENKYMFVRHIEKTEGIKILTPPGGTPA